MEEVEDFESRPNKAVSILVESEKEMQGWNEQKLPKVLPGYSGGRLPGRSIKEKDREEWRGGCGQEGEGKRACWYQGGRTKFSRAKCHA